MSNLIQKIVIKCGCLYSPLIFSRSVLRTKRGASSRLTREVSVAPIAIGGEVVFPRERRDETHPALCRGILLTRILQLNERERWFVRVNPDLVFVRFSYKNKIRRKPYKHLIATRKEFPLIANFGLKAIKPTRFSIPLQFFFNFT
jgi:hypothetical protein